MISVLSKRLSRVASFIDKGDKIIDVGCDHAYLDIDLIRQNKCKSAIASDVNENALHIAKKNIQKEHLEDVIPTILTDGIIGVDPSLYDTIVISGMGTSTILHILSEPLVHVSKIILQSNNDYPLLRKKMNEKGFYLEKEDIVLDRGKFYITMLFSKDGKKSSKNEILFGKHPIQNEAYIRYIYQSLDDIKEKLPKKKKLLHWKLARYQKKFTKYIAKQRKRGYSKKKC